jgi:uncharacterized metal-binding protein YceD (DUF177 family)
MMKKQANKCILPFASLKNGEYDYLFTLDSSLFSENSFADIHKASIMAQVKFEKNSGVLAIVFNITGQVNVTCDRCSEDFDMNIDLHKKLFVKTNAILHSEEDDMISLTGDETDLDIAPLVYQYVALSLPMQKVHGKNSADASACNPETIKKLKTIEVSKSNDELFIQTSNLHFESLHPKS